mgnify:CR=1 FL=1
MSDEPRRFGLFRNDPNTRHYASGAVVFSQGEEDDTMFAVSRGSVGIEVDGRRVAVLGPDEVFGEMALLEHGPRSATALALEQSELVEIDKTRFYILVRQNPHFALQLMQLLSERLRRADALYRVDG